jgi:hypothetical protein
MGSALGVRKIAAKRVGLTLEQYDARVAAGEKWCGRCREWHPVAVFGSDRTRYDGLASYCAESRVVAVDRPGARERRIKREAGLAWCRNCEAWLPVEDVYGGLCQPHAAAEARAYYAANRAGIRQRKLEENRARDLLEPVPEWWQEQIMEDFGSLCAYGCGRAATGLDHIIPVSKGGQSRPTNLLPACKPCNSAKKDRDPMPWVKRFALAFPEQFEAFVGLVYEHAAPLELEEVA